MRQRNKQAPQSAEETLRDIRRATRCIEVSVEVEYARTTAT